MTIKTRQEKTPSESLVDVRGHKPNESVELIVRTSGRKPNYQEVRKLLTNVVIAAKREIRKLEAV